MPSRYEASQSPDEIEDHVDYLFDVNPVARSLDPTEYQWEFEWVDIDEIDAETEDHDEQSNVALYERRVAVEKAQLTVGEGNPLVVVGDDNTLVEGYTRYKLLQDHFDEAEVPVYRARPSPDIEAPSAETVAVE